MTDLSKIKDGSAQSQMQPDHAADAAATSTVAPSALKPSDVLAKAADLIEPEGAWTQFVGAWIEPIRRPEDMPLTEEGDPSEGLSYRSPDARCFCLDGAIWRVASGESPVARAAYERVRKLVDEEPFEWNDRPERTQAEVVKALRDAADLARAEGQ